MHPPYQLTLKDEWISQFKFGHHYNHKYIYIERSKFENMCVNKGIDFNAFAYYAIPLMMVNPRTKKERLFKTPEDLHKTGRRYDSHRKHRYSKYTDAFGPSFVFTSHAQNYHDNGEAIELIIIQDK